MRLVLLLTGTVLLAAPAFAQPATISGPGDDALDVSYIQPQSQTFTMTVMQGPASQPAGNGTSVITIDEDAGVIEAIRTMNVMGQKLADTTRAAWPSLAAISHRSENMQRMLSFDVTDGQLVGEAQPNNGEAESFEMSLDGPIFDSSWIGTLVAALPLAEGYTATIPAYEFEAGGIATYTIEVLGEEKLTREGHPPVDAWRVQTSRDGEGGQTLTSYLEKESHDLLRISLEPQPGLTVHVDFTNS